MAYRIGQVAKRAGMTAEGLRYYEKRGLLRPSERTRSGYRLYGEPEIDRLRFIRAALEAKTYCPGIGVVFEAQVQGGDEEVFLVDSRRPETSLGTPGQERSQAVG